MNQSFTSTYSVNSQLSLKSEADQAPLQLFGYLYDVPKGTKATDLKKVFLDNYIDCNIQIKREATKPFDSAMVKFQNSAHLQVASEKLRYFETSNGQKIRFLPYENNLFRGDISSLVDTSVNRSMTNSMLDDDKEN
jgi:RNA recognition motif-containing protein